MSEPRWFLVVSRECSEVDPILEDGSGPLEYFRDYCYVRTTTRRRARILMARRGRRFYGSQYPKSRWTRHRWPDWLTDGNPFTGMTATPSESPRAEDEEPLEEALENLPPADA